MEQNNDSGRNPGVRSPSPEFVDAPEQPIPEANKKFEFRLALQPSLKGIIRQTRKLTKAQHHVEILSEALKTEKFPRGLRPNINPRVPNSQEVKFVDDWEGALNTTAQVLTQCLLAKWIKEQERAELQIQEAEATMRDRKVTKEEMLEVHKIRDQVVVQTKLDMERSKDERRKEIKDKKRTENGRPIAKPSKMFKGTPSTSTLDQAQPGTSNQNQNPFQPPPQTETEYPYPGTETWSTETNKRKATEDLPKPPRQ